MVSIERERDGREGGTGKEKERVSDKEEKRYRDRKKETDVGCEMIDIDICNQGSTFVVSLKLE